MTTPAATLWRKLAGSGTKFFRDYIVLAGGQVIAKLLGFAAFAWLARVLNPVDYGAVEYVVGLAVFFAMLVDGGLDVIGTRRVGRDPAELPLLAFQIPAARLLLALVAVPAMLIIATQLMKATVPLALVLLFALSLLTTPWRQQWLFQATERMAAAAIADMLRMGVFAALIWTLVRTPGDMLTVGWAEIAAVSAMTLYCLMVQHHRIARIRLRGSFAGFGALLHEGAAVGSTNLVWALNQYAPLFLIGALIGGVATAWFAAASRIVTSLVTFSNLYHFNLYPSVTRNYARGDGSLGILLARSLRVTGWGATFLALVLTVFAAPIVRIALGPKLLDAAPLLAVMAWMVPVTIWSGHARWGLAAAGAQTRVLWSQCIGLATTVGLALALGHIFGAIGYAIASLAGFVIVWVAAHRFARLWGCAPPPFRLVLLPLALAGAIIALNLLVPLSTVLALASVAAYAALAPLLDRTLIADIILLGGTKRNYGTAKPETD
ncbi:MAG TPA: oligosaccharide flippase family protein [Polymorphobacter sp.]|mgnify:FL=1|nr:oligosaccharide flippase family protein [Polymorphobacter sp.]